MPENDEVVSSNPCPNCLNVGMVSPLKNRPGRFETYCDQQHKWNDTEELMMALKAAKKRFPKEYQPLTPKPDAAQNQRELAAAGVFIDVETKQLLEGILGTTLTGAGDLKGAVFAMAQDLKEAKEAAATISSAAGAGPGKAQLAYNQLVLTVPEWALESVKELAAHEGKTADKWAQEQWEGYIEAYLSPMPGRG